MSSSNSEEQTIQNVKVLYEVESFSSEEPPIETWSSLNAQIPDENVKRILYEQGLYSPGSGEICAKYLPLSASSGFRHPYYNYPAIQDPGIKKALFDPQPRTIIYSDDGQELYLDLCREMSICPIRNFYRQLLDREVDLRYYGIHPMGFRAIAMSLSNNRIVKVLDLTDNWISEDGCYHLGEMLVTNISLEELNLHGCRIGAEGARRLFASVHVNRTLRKIDLTKNCLADDGVEHLSKAIVAGSDVTIINLSYNSLTAKSLAALTTAFETHNKLTHLNLSWNTISSPSAVFNLCKMLSENMNLEEVNLSWNSLSGVGTAIKQLMKAPKLKSLYLCNNKLSAEVKQIARGLSSSNLTTLDLSYNPLTPNHALFLLSYLKNRAVKIQTLFLENVIVTAEFLELRDKILSLKFRKNAVITCGEILSEYFSKGGDMREIVLNRAEFLCSKSKKSAVDIGLLILEIHKNNIGPMELKPFSKILKRSGASGLDDDLIEEIANSFPGPGVKKAKTVDLVKLVDYVHRKWPEKKLPPTPPPEVPEVKDKKKKKEKKK